MQPIRISVAIGLALLLFSGARADAAEWFVAAGGQGDGSRGAPFGRVQQGLDAAGPGDVVSIGPGTFTESLATVRPGLDDRPISLRAAGGRGSVIITASGRVLTVRHPHIIVDGVVLDGQYGYDVTVRVTTAASGFVLRNTEVRRSSRDAVDIGSPSDVVIDNCLIHHALNPAAGRTDAHGIVAQAVKRLTIRKTEIHTFSGDGIQLDPARASPGWDEVLIEHCRIWLAPLPRAENGFAAGSVPGENALDTKSGGRFGRARITVRDTEAWGFQQGSIENMAAFNLKENIDALLDGITVHDSQIAFRLRGRGPNGGSRVTVLNAVVYASEVAFRYEDNIERLQVWNCTVGAGVQRPFLAASSNRSGLDVQNLAVLADTLPIEAPAAGSNKALPARAFVDAGSTHDYRLAPGSPAIDAGATLPAVAHDRAGTPRPQGRRYDVGAYERPVPGGA